MKAKTGTNVTKNRTDSFNNAPSKGGPEQQKKGQQKAKSSKFSGRKRKDLHGSKARQK